MFSVIPDPVRAPWDLPRAREDLESREDSELFGRLRRAPGAAGGLMTLEGWMAHWQMVGDPAAVYSYDIVYDICTLVLCLSRFFRCGGFLLLF